VNDPACIEYVIPDRWDTDEDLHEFTAYLRQLSEVVDVTVVDGCDDELFAAHNLAWPPRVRRLRPGGWPGRNRKVANVVTGVQTARHKLVIIADDDVRYRTEQLQQITAILLENPADLVRPQNVFSSAPWHARWDTARTLFNRAFGADYPGTFAMRRSTFLRMGGYDGDVLFENLQMIRTFYPAGAVEVIAKDLFIIRRPPTAARFFDQRIRQAYDDFAQPARLVVEAAWLPAIPVACRRPWTLCGGMLAAVLVAETGRRRNNGTTAFPPNSGWAPVWVLERAVCVWIALLLRLAGGVRYRGTRISLASKPGTARPPLPLLNVPAYEGQPMDDQATSVPAAQISLCQDGPMLIRGDITLIGVDGAEIPRTRAVMALCRCGKTAEAPFCDGTHKLIRNHTPG